MMYVFGKIMDYQQALFDKTKEDKLFFNKKDEIKIGNNVYIKGIYLAMEDEEYVIAYMSDYPDIEIPIRLDILCDSVLVNLMHILRRCI